MTTKKLPAVTLVIPDAQDDPTVSQERFTALGKFIVDHRPDNIVQIGDWMNLDSINFFDNRKPLLKEGRRLAEDIKSGQRAYELMMEPIRKLWKKQAKWKSKKYNPKRYWMFGNHEYRTYRYTLDKPELAGFVPEKDLIGVDRDGWKIIPYKDYVYINGTAFTHIPMNKRNNQPIRGEYVARRACETHDTSVVFGHTHRFLVHCVKRASEGGKTPLVQAVSVGWYGDYWPEYMKGNEHNCDWWAGLVLLTHTGHGQVDVNQYSLNRIKKEYL